MKLLGRLVCCSLPEVHLHEAESCCCGSVLQLLSVPKVLHQLVYFLEQVTADTTENGLCKIIFFFKPRTIKSFLTYVKFKITVRKCLMFSHTYFSYITQPPSSMSLIGYTSYHESKHSLNNMAHGKEIKRDRIVICLAPNYLWKTFRRE